MKFPLKSGLVALLLFAGCTREQEPLSPEMMLYRKCCEVSYCVDRPEDLDYHEQTELLKDLGVPFDLRLGEKVFIRPAEGRLLFTIAKRDDPQQKYSRAAFTVTRERLIQYLAEHRVKETKKKR
jgi:hypothetical protein